MTEKLQKVLARAGYGSRRQLEGWIADGRVTVNRKTATLGDRVGPEDHLSIDGKPVDARKLVQIKRRVIAYHKPAGEVSARTDEDGRATVFENLPPLQQGRWISVGRLDINTSGLLLFTTDGELANRLMHPSSEVDREYAVRVRGLANEKTLQALLKGITLEDGPAHFEHIREAGGAGTNHWYHVTLKEGRKREVRRLWEAMGHSVSRLIRIRYGPVKLGRETRAGKYRDLDDQQVNRLMQQVGMAVDMPEAAKKAGRHKSKVSRKKRSRK